VAGPGSRRTEADARRAARRSHATTPRSGARMLDALEVVIDLGLDPYVIAALDAAVAPDLALARAANEIASDSNTWRT